MSSDLTGRTVAGYRVLGLLGAGGMGEVYRAVQIALDREVALKVLPGGGGDHLVQRFRREGEIHVRLAHPGLVRVFDVGCDDALRWIAMELVDGTTLARAIDASAPLPLEFLLPAASALAGTLAYLHDRSVVHRDVKPQNVLLARTGEVKLTDFGVAQSSHQTTMTQAGSLLGTLAYMAPEALDGGHEAGPAADVYALGLMIHEMVTGRLPYEASDFVGWLEAIRSAPVARVAPRRPGLPPGLDDLLQAMLAKEPEVRPEARAVSATLERLAAEAASPEAASSATPDRREPTLALQLAARPGAARTSWRTEVIRVGAVVVQPVQARAAAPAPLTEVTAIHRPARAASPPPPPPPPRAAAPGPRPSNRVAALPVPARRAGPAGALRAALLGVTAVAVAFELAVAGLAWQLRSGPEWSAPAAYAVTAAAPVLLRFASVRAAVLAGAADADERRALPALEVAVAAGLDAAPVADAFVAGAAAPLPESGRRRLAALMALPAAAPLAERWLDRALRDHRVPPRVRGYVAGPGIGAARAARLARLLESDDPADRAAIVQELAAIAVREPLVRAAYDEIAGGKAECEIRLDAVRAAARATDPGHRVEVLLRRLGDPCPKLDEEVRDAAIRELDEDRDERGVIAAFARCPAVAIPAWIQMLTKFKYSSRHHWPGDLDRLVPLRVGPGWAAEKALASLCADASVLPELERLPELRDAVSVALCECASRLGGEVSSVTSPGLAGGQDDSVVRNPFLDAWHKLGCRAPAGGRPEEVLRSAVPIRLGDYLPLDATVANGSAVDAARILEATFDRGSNDAVEAAIDTVVAPHRAAELQRRPDLLRPAISRLLAREPPPARWGGGSPGVPQPDRWHFSRLITAGFLDTPGAVRELLAAGAGPGRMLAVLDLQTGWEFWPQFAALLRARAGDAAFEQALRTLIGRRPSGRAQQLLGHMAESGEPALVQLAQRLDPTEGAITSGRLEAILSLPAEQHAARLRAILTEKGDQVQLDLLHYWFVHDPSTDARLLVAQYTRVLNCAVARNFLREMSDDASPEVRLEVARRARECGFDALCARFATDSDPRVREAAGRK